MDEPVKINFTIRDALQANLGMNVPADEIVEATENAQYYGVHSIQTSGGTAWDLPIKKGRDPIHFNGTILDHFESVQSTALGRGDILFGYERQPYDQQYEQLKFHAEHGLNHVQNFNGNNDIEMMRGPIKAILELQEQGFDIHGWGSICIQENPNTLENEDQIIAEHVEFAKTLLEVGHEALYLKNANGVLRPEFTGKLVTALREELGDDLPIHVHVHDTYGHAVGNYLAAIKAGATGVDILPDALAGGTGQASLSLLMHAMEHSGDADLVARMPKDINYDAIEDDHDVQVLMRAAYSQTEMKFDLENIRKAEAAGSAGGAISAIKAVRGLVENLGRKLETDDWDTIRNAIYERKAENREALGYPVNVTPLELMMDLQAAQDVFDDEQFKTLSPLTVKYLTGQLGKVFPDVDPELQQRALDLAGLDEVVTLEAVETLEQGLPKGREHLIKAGVENPTDYEVLVAASGGEDGVKLVTGQVEAQEPRIIQSRRLEGVSILIADVAYKAVEITKLRAGFYTDVKEQDVLADQIQENLDSTVDLIEERLHEMDRHRGIASQANRELKRFADRLGADVSLIPLIDIDAFPDVQLRKKEGGGFQNTQIQEYDDAVESLIQDNLRTATDISPTELSAKEGLRIIDDLFLLDDDLDDVSLPGDHPLKYDGNGSDGGPLLN